MSILRRHRKTAESVEPCHSLASVNSLTLAIQTALTVTISLAPMALLSACSEKAVAPHTTAQDIQELPVTEVIKQTLSRVDQLPGEIQAYQDVAVYPKVPGFIDWIGVDRGSKVKKGQVICRLIAPELLAQSNESAAKAKAVGGELQQAQSKLASAKASLLEAKAQLAGDEDTYNRTKEASLVPGVVAPNDVVVLGQKVEADKEKVKAWQENIAAAANAVKSLTDSLVAAKKASENYKDISQYLTITAPFDGYVTERNMHVGSFVGPLGHGAYPSIVRVQELDLLRIVTPVPEAIAGGVVPGADVEFTVSTHPSEKFKGKVARIGNYLDQKTRTMPVELNYPNPGWRILPGMFCEVFWPTKRPHPSLFLPPSAVETTSTLSTFVCRIKDGEVEWVPVVRGEMMNSLTEVFGELKPGDLVALRCTDALKPHTKVKPILTAAKEALPESARPGYNNRGVFYQTPDAEKADLKAPENSEKPKAF